MKHLKLKIISETRFQMLWASKAFQLATNLYKEVKMMKTQNLNFTTIDHHDIKLAGSKVTLRNSTITPIRVQRA